MNNADLSLRPGMTATATIVSTERKGVLLVPNTALRFIPTSTQAPEATASGGSLVSRMMPRPSSPPKRKKDSEASASNGNNAQRQIWVLQDQQPTAINVQAGISNGRQTEISGPELKEGMAVITDQRSAQGGT